MRTPDLVDLEHIIITKALFQRPPRATNFEAENNALHKLAYRLTESPQDLLQSLVSLAVDICQAGSAGISVPGVKTNGEEIFRWIALAGAYADAEATVPRYASICNLCLERGAPQLYSYPARYFKNFKQLQPPMVECLVLPLTLNTHPLGTIWVVTHDDAKQFDSEDLRVMGSLAQFTALSLHQMKIRREAEAATARERQSRQKAEDAIRLRDEFIATVSHELRTPLANMKIAIRMLTLSTSECQSERYLRILDAECDREVKLVNTLLDLQRLEAGMESVTPSATPLLEWLLSIVEPFKARMSDHQQVLDLQIPANLPTLMIDTLKLERIIAELLNNACKYTPAKGVVQISVSLTPNLLELSVSNTGVEIPSHALPKLFDKFYRAAEGGQTDHGAGLGLALVQKLVELIEGKILVKSQHQLTTFTVVLPRIDAEWYPHSLYPGQGSPGRLADDGS